jgi:Zn-dependent protease with chaperone function
MRPRSAAGAVNLAQATAAAPAKRVKEHAKSAPSQRVKATPVRTSTPSKAAPVAAKPRGRLTQQELFAAFREPFPRSRPRISYRIGILLISLTMVLLPLVYLAFIALVGFGVYYHAVNHTWLLEMGRGRSRAFVALVYAAPLVAGPIAVFFMFKPLLARPSVHQRSRSLRRESEPLLFAFIDRICEKVGAPRPKRIDVDCTVNASASFRRGILSMIGRDLVLTIGLPMAAGLTVREFGGVMAHELGHFAQGLGMRLSYLVRSIVDWFIRVVYQRDQWDDWLDETAEELDFRVGWIFLVAKLFVMIGRGILWVLFHIGLTISGIMLRQMEFDADGYECRFAGSRAFASAMRKLHLLNGASQVAQMQLSASLDLRKLVDNYPGLITYHAQKIASEALPHIVKAINESKTGWFDSHPSDKDRIAAAEKLASPGVFHCDRPAADLFTDFHAQSAAATWDLYVGYFGPKVPRTALQPLSEFLAAMASSKQSR